MALYVFFTIFREHFFRLGQNPFQSKSSTGHNVRGHLVSRDGRGRTQRDGRRRVDGKRMRSPLRRGLGVRRVLRPCVRVHVALC